MSARALASRGLISISGRGDSWKASATPRGEVWPAVTEEDAVVVARQIKLVEVKARTATEADAKPANNAQLPIEQRRRIQAVKELSRAEKRQRLVDGLTQRVLLAGEPITLMEEKWEHTELEWMRKAAERSPDRPHGQVLGIRHTGYREEGNYVLYFEPYFRDLVEQTEVIVPEKVSRYLPPVRVSRR
ncbi:hypothetical protein [Leucobacter sp. 7(1)]|uniref:hypothetical protein n=1 Tax=Leucobacter sp. 7(1) TaxID=1255613 RepID=UPI001120EA7C|nr:hypothetical protein [Leucobacter sp. 7(1)]